MIVDPHLLIFKGECNILGKDQELANIRIFIISTNEVILVHKTYPQQGRIKISLRSITSVSLMPAAVASDKLHREGGLPHMTIRYIAKDSTGKRFRNEITLWTIHPVWRADYYLRNAIQNSLIRSYDLISNGRLFKQHPFLFPKAVDRLSLSNIYSLLATLEDPTLISNPLFKLRFWDPIIRKSLTERLEKLYSKVFGFCRARSKEYGFAPLAKETVEEKIKRIKATPFIYKRFRPADVVSPITPIELYSPTNQDFEDVLEEYGNNLLVLNAFLCDIPFNEKGFQAWQLEKTNPIELTRQVVCLSHLGSISMAEQYNLSPKAVSLLEHIQMRSIKCLWNVYCLVRPITILRNTFKKSILAELVVCQSGMLQSCLCLVMHWLGIYCQRKSLFGQSITVSEDLAPFNGNTSKLPLPHLRTGVAPTISSTTADSAISPTMSTTTMTVPSLKLSLLQPPIKENVTLKITNSRMSRSLSAKVYRSCLVLFLAFQANEKAFRDEFGEEIKYIVENFLQRIDYKFNSPENDYHNETRMENWIFSVLETLV